MKNSTTFLIILIYAALSFQAKAQQVIASSGGFYEGENINLSWTLGEPVIETFSGGGVILTQGFQQPYMLYVTQIINLPSGWSGISSYVSPAQKAMEAVFDPIISDLIIVQDMEGMFYPAMNTNTIGNWNSHAAFKVKTGAAVALPVTGQKEPDFVVELDAGWGLLPVVSHCPVDIAGLFEPVVSHLTIVKDIAGTGVYWPAMNINSIGQLLPGKAYFVKMSSSGNVVFPACGKSKNLTGLPNLSGLEGLAITPTPSTHTIAILPQALKGFERGTIIGASDQAGNCFGAMVYNSEFISLTVFGDDPTTAEKDGFFDGEMITFQTLTGFQTLSGLTPTFDQTLPQSDGLFTQNGLSAITGFEAASGIGIEGFGATVSIYPNPTSGLVNISGLDGDTEITITDAKGQEIKQDISKSDQLLTLDLSGCMPGVCFIKIQQNGKTTFEKIVLY